MAEQTQCITCGKARVTYKCDGCSQTFCFNHLADHRQILNQQFDEIENERNLFRQILSEQTTNTQKYSLIQQINQWENDSNQKIKQTADDARRLLLKYKDKHIHQIEMKLNKLTEELKEIRQENDFNEIHLNQFNEKLNKLKEELNQPKHLSIKQESTSFINRIFVQLEQLFIPNLNIDQTWKQYGTTTAGVHGIGNGLNQLFGPCGVFIDDDQTIYVADWGNHRIVEWKSDANNGQIVAGGNGRGNRNDQLNGPTKVIVDKENDSLIICDRENRRVVRWPRRNGQSGETIISNIYCWDLIIDNDGYLYVSDPEIHEVRRWKMGETNETLVAGGNGQGDRLDQLDYPTHLFVDEDHSVYVSEPHNHRVMKWVKNAKEGIVVAGGQGEGNSLRQLSNPNGIIVDQMGSVYVADEGNHRVIRWLKGAQEGTIVVGGNGQGEQPNQFNRPVDLSFDRQNNLYVVEWGNNRVQKFDANSK